VLGWNIRGFDNNKEAFDNFVEAYKVDICMLQETWRTFDFDIFGHNLTLPATPQVNQSDKGHACGGIMTSSD